MQELKGERSKMPKFKCGLCKNLKENYEVTTIVFVTGGSVQSDKWCNICMYKIINICKSPRIDEARKQMVMDQWNLKL